MSTATTAASPLFPGEDPALAYLDCREYSGTTNLPRKSTPGDTLKPKNRHLASLPASLPPCPPHFSRTVTTGEDMADGGLVFKWKVTDRRQHYPVAPPAA